MSLQYKLKDDKNTTHILKQLTNAEYNSADLQVSLLANKNISLHLVKSWLCLLPFHTSHLSTMNIMFWLLSRFQLWRANKNHLEGNSRLKQKLKKEFIGTSHPHTCSCNSVLVIQLKSISEFCKDNPV